LKNTSGLNLECIRCVYNQSSNYLFDSDTTTSRPKPTKGCSADWRRKRYNQHL